VLKAQAVERQKELQKRMDVKGKVIIDLRKLGERGNKELV
jgi:hypothetical protein